MKKSLLSLLAIAVMLVGIVSQASATLVLRDAFQNAALSIDGWGSTSSSGLIKSDVPVNSTILKAYLYSANVWGGGVAGDVTLNGNFLSSASGIQLTPDNNPAMTRLYDVTSFMKPTIEGTWGLQSHPIMEGGNSDGEVLVVAYSNASTLGQTAIIMDGELSTTGDTTTLGFANPYSGGDLLMSLAISFSYGDSQFTEVDVTTDSTVNRRLTSAAGGNDDGGFVAANGALITAGGIDDSTMNPADPFGKGDDYDDELYNLALGNSVDPTPFINVGDTFLKLTTRNPSNDDNVFAMFLTSTFKISDVDGGGIDDDPDPIPEPSTVILLGLGLAALAGREYKRRNK